MDSNSRKKILAANMWPIWNLGDPNKRYQSFLQRGRPEFISFIEQALLYDEIIVPTQDFLSLTILLGVLGEKAIQDLLASNSLKFIRVKGTFGYVGNGGGIQYIELFRSKEEIHNPVSADIEHSVNWSINNLEVKVKDQNFVKKILDNTTEIGLNTISDVIKSETYQDVNENEELQKYFTLRNKNLDQLAGIKPAEVRFYGGIDANQRNYDEIDTYLLLNNTNLEIKLMEISNSIDLTTSNPIGHLLKAKFERQKTKVQSSFATLKEIAGIPDFGEAILQERININQLLKIKDSKNGIRFREWFHNNCQGDDKLIAKEYIKVLEDVSIISSLPIKILRFIITNGVGFVPGVGNALGAAGGLIDSFFIEKWASGTSPKFFINDLKQMANK